jgi:hypothetical protein
VALTFKVRRGTFALLPVLADGEPGFTTDTHALYVGYGGVNYNVGVAGGPAATCQEPTRTRTSSRRPVPSHSWGR